MVMTLFRFKSLLETPLPHNLNRLWCSFFPITLSKGFMLLSLSNPDSCNDASSFILFWNLSQLLESTLWELRKETPNLLLDPKCFLVVPHGFCTNHVLLNLAMKIFYLKKSRKLNYKKSCTTKFSVSHITNKSMTYNFIECIAIWFFVCSSLFLCSSFFEHVSFWWRLIIFDCLKHMHILLYLGCLILGQSHIKKYKFISINKIQFKSHQLMKYPCKAYITRCVHTLLLFTVFKIFGTDFLNKRHNNKLIQISSQSKLL